MPPSVNVCGSAADGADSDTAVAPHVERGRGLGVLGAEVDGNDELAQPRAKEGHGSGRKVPDHDVFSYRGTI